MSQSNNNYYRYDENKEKKTRKDKRIEKKIARETKLSNQFEEGKSYNVSGSFKEKKPLSFGAKLLIFVLIFAGIAAITTLILIKTYQSYLVKDQKKIAEKYEETERKESDSSLGISSEFETYNENDLKVTYVKGTEGDVISESSNNTFYKVNYEYPQIEGLKSFSTQENINNELKETAFSLYTEEDENNLSLKYVEIKGKVLANYSNVLSVKFTKKIVYTSDKESNEMDFVGLNYDLSSNEHLSFSQLFTNAISTKQLLYQKSYDYLISKTYGVKGSKLNVDQLNYIEFIEDSVFKIINSWNNKENFEFCFDNTNIELFIGGEYIKINMPKIKNNIAIFKRFANNNGIYNGKYSGYKNLALFKKYEEQKYYYIMIENVSENLFMDIRFVLDDNLSENDAIKKIKDNYIKLVSNKKEELKNQLRQNPNVALVYTSIVYLTNDITDNTRYEVSESNDSYEMNIDYYNDIYKMVILNVLRKDVKSIRQSDYYIPEGDEENVSKSEETTTVYYMKDTGEEFVEQQVDYNEYINELFNEIDDINIIANMINAMQANSTSTNTSTNTNSESDAPVVTEVNVVTNETNNTPDPYEELYRNATYQNIDENGVIIIE